MTIGSFVLKWELRLFKAGISWTSTHVVVRRDENGKVISGYGKSV